MEAAGFHRFLQCTNGVTFGSFEVYEKPDGWHWHLRHPEAPFSYGEGEGPFPTAEAAYNDAVAEFA